MDDDVLGVRLRQLEDDIAAINEALPKLQDVCDILNYVKMRLNELKEWGTG